MKNVFFFFSALIFFACSPGGENSKSEKQSMAETEMTKPSDSFNQLFEEVNVVKMHLFGSPEADPTSESYPYVGTAIPEEYHNLLGEGVNAAKGTVYACYLTENSEHYILRIPGKGASGDLILAKWDGDANKLVKINNLAYLWCDDGTCTQQDAWLTDLDDDRDLELVIRQHQRDGQGNVSDEKFTVSTDNGSGEFNPATESLAALAVKDRYVMQ